MKALLSMNCVLNHDLMTTVRLTTGGICSHAGLDIDAAEDCKVCVTEAMLLLMHRGFRAVLIDFCEEDGIFVRLAGQDNVPINNVYPEDEISSALLGALAEEVNMQKEGGLLSEISFRFTGNGR